MLLINILSTVETVSMEDFANVLFTPQIIGLIFIMGYLSTQIFEGAIGNYISSRKRKKRKRNKKIKKRNKKINRKPKTVSAQPSVRQLSKSRSTPTKDATASKSSSRIMRIIVILMTIQLLPQLFTELGLSDEILQIFSYGILDNFNSYSWLQWSLILSAAYLGVESTFETENFHLFSIPIVFLSATVIQGTFPTPLFFVYCFLFMSILQAMKVENSNLSVLGLSSDIRDYIGVKKYPAQLFITSVIQGRNLPAHLHANPETRRRNSHGWLHLDESPLGDVLESFRWSRWLILQDNEKDRLTGIFCWLLVVALLTIDMAFLDGSFADGDAATIGILIYVTLVFLALTYHGIIFATWVWFFSYGFTETYSEIPDTLVTLALPYIIFYPMRHYFNNRKIMDITNLITPRPIHRIVQPRNSTLKEELRSHGWMGKIYIWIKLAIFGLLNNLIVSLICVVQLLVGLLVLIINAIYLFITGWLRSFGFSEVAIGERYEITIVDLKYHLAGLSIVIIDVASSIIHGLVAPWLSAYWFFESDNAAEPPEGAGYIWYLFRNSERAKFPFFYYLAGAISWYHSFYYIAAILIVILILGALVVLGSSS